MTEPRGACEHQRIQSTSLVRSAALRGVMTIVAFASVVSAQNPDLDLVNPTSSSNSTGAIAVTFF